MFAATRRWFRRNRTPIAIGLGVVGAGYVATQYILNKLNDARERMSSDRIAKENLRRRFQQNQEDCTYTVLALLPTATAKILEAMDVERITLEIQQMRGAGGSSASRSVKSGSGDSMSLPETTGLTDEDGRSMVSTSESGVHASQITIPPASQASEGGEEQLRPEKPRRTKRQLWGDVTISSITRAYTLIYTLGLLTMLTRVQLNLLGRRSYLSSVVSLATGPNSAAISLENNDDDNDEDDSSTQAYGDDFEVNRKYLTFSWWLLNRGWADVMQRVEAAVRQVFGQTSPRDQLSLETFAAMTGQVRRLVEGSAAFTDPQTGGGGSSTTTTTTSWLPFLLPPPDMEDHVLRESGILDDSAASVTQTTHLDGREPLQPPPPPPPPSSPTSAASLRRLLDETSDLIESPTFAHVLTQILDAGFSTLLEDKLATGAFEMPPPPPQQQQQQQQQDRQGQDQDQEQQAPGAERKKVLLPRCLSVLTRQAHAIGSGAPPNEYLQTMESVRDLEGFAAVVYSSNWDTEMRDEVGPPSSNSNSSSGGGGGGMGTGTGQAGFATAGSSVVMMGPGDGEESLVLVDPSQSSFESAWVKATGGSSQP